jgi:hypothetical protein
MINFARLNEDVEKEFVSTSSGPMSKFLPDTNFRDTLSSLKESFVALDKN